MTSFLKTKTFYLSLIATVVLAGATTVGIALATSDSSNSAPPESGAPYATSPDAVAEHDFGILRRDQNGEDAIPAAASVMFSGASGANEHLARRAKGFSEGEAWVVPGRGSVCLIADWPAAHNGGATCASDEPAIDGRLVSESSNRHSPGAVFVAGLVPDGISRVTVNLANGGSQAADVHENVYMIKTEGSVASVTVSTPSGNVNVPFSVPAGKVTH